jgi:hypothetical protein
MLRARVRSCMSVRVLAAWFGGWRAAWLVASLVVLVVVLGGVRPAVGSPLEPDGVVAFTWTAPAGCPGAAELRQRTEARLGRSLDGAIHGIEIEVRRERGGFVATLDARAITVENDIRTLRSRDCSELADAVALILVRLASDAWATRSVPVDRAPPRPVSAPPPVVGFVAPEPVSASPSPLAQVAARVPGRTRVAGRWGGGLHVLGLSGVGPLPKVNLGVEVAAFLRRYDHFGELAVARWVPQAAYLQLGAPPRVDVSLDVVTLRAGWGPRHLPIRVWLMGELGELRGMGVAVSGAQTRTARWSAAGAGFLVAWPMSRYARLIGTVELAFPFERAQFVLASGSRLHQPALAAARCSFGLEVGWR